MKNHSIKEFDLNLKAGRLYLPNTRKPVSETDLWSYLKTKGVDFKNMDEVCESLYQEAESKGKMSGGDTFKRLDFMAARVSIFETCIYKQKLKTMKFNGNILGYIEHEKGWKPLGIAVDLEPKDLVKGFTICYADGLKELQGNINDLAAGLNGPAYTHIQIAEMYIEDILLASEELIDTSLKTSPHPLLLQGDSRPALIYMPYDRTAPAALNTALQEFFSRMNEHEYFCAYLYCNFLGYEIQQLLYIYGEGGDGKSSFIRMLSDKTQSLVAYSDNSKHSFFNMADKSIISLSESTEKHILLKPSVKQLTGRDSVAIEAKYKNSYTDRIRGLFIVDSNNKPYVIGQQSETRRLRIFEMKANKNIQKIIAPPEYVAMLSENFDGFLSYCANCYETLKDETGLVQDPPSLKRKLGMLKDANMTTLYDKLLQKLHSKRYILSKEHTVTEKQLRSDIYSLTLTMSNEYRVKYFTDNFLQHLKYDLGVIFDDSGNLQGFGQEEETSTKSGTRYIK